MKGLVLKDLYYVLSYIKTLGAIVVLIALLLSFSGSYEMAIFMISFLVMTISFTTCSYDEYYNWDQLSIVLPPSRKQIVASKYISTIIINLVGFVLSGLYCIAITSLNKIPSSEQIILSFSMSICVLISSYSISFILPLSYRFGSQKMKIFTVAVLSLPTLIILISAKLFPTAQSTLSLDNFIANLNQNTFTCLISSILVGLLFMSLSYFISLRIFKKKQF